MSARPKRSGRSPGRTVVKDEDFSPKKDRPKSPGRQARPKSPARARPKSPARKSPGRPKSPGRTKSPARVIRKMSPSPPPAKRAPSSRLTTIKKKASPIRVASEVFVTLKKEDFDEPFRSLSRSITEKKLIEAREGLDVLARERTSSADSSAVIIRRSVRVSSYKEAERKSSSEENDVDERSAINSLGRSKTASEHGKPPREFGGWPGALVFIFVLPLTALAIQLYCSKDKCGTSFRIIPNWRLYFDLEAASWYLGFIVFQALLSLIPGVGPKVDAPPGRTGRYEYRCNGIFSLVVTFLALGGMFYFKCPLLRVFDKQLPIVETAILFGLTLSIILYIRGGRAPISALNPNGISGNFIYDFWMGREINPRFGRLDVKTVLFRSAVIGTIVLNALYVLKALESQTKKVDGGSVKVPWAEKEYPPALLLVAGLQIFYMLDVLFTERSFPSTFEATSEGTGYMLAVGFSVYAFIPTLITKYLVFNRVEIPWYGLTLISLVFFVGYVIARCSNNQKNTFRSNPMNPAVTHLETLSTTRGKRLLVSGWWGWVRHPNYLGDIIMHWSWASACLLTHWLPYTVPLSVTILLLHRAVRDNARCRQRYGVSWERYSARVKSLVIPKVF